MAEKVNAEGLVRGRLTALDDGKPKILCQCSCGNRKHINRNHFLSGNIGSCGCLRKEKLTEYNTSHGKTNTRLYSIWSNMKSRCYNTKVACYKHYGGRGITVDESWHTFEGFMDNLPEGYSCGLELDRIDNEKGYSLDNCRWSTRSEQCVNRRSLGDDPERGVSYVKRDNLYKANITKDGKRYQKYFKSREDAIEWRKTKEEELYGK